MTTDPPIRDAATIVLLRRGGDTASVLMGQRGAGAVFMPSKYVFPGGRVDRADHGILSQDDLDPASAARLALRAPADIGPALAAAALRELHEETGLSLSSAAGSPARRLKYFFRAITPPGRPRRFDARFFLANAADLESDPDDFSAADDELGHLHWVPLPEARALDLPFITEIVLAELSARLTDADSDARPVPFFDHAESISRFHAL